jgi:hypothetical protein
MGVGGTVNEGQFDGERVNKDQRHPSDVGRTDVVEAKSPLVSGLPLSTCQT